LGTTGAHLACAINTNLVPAGMQPTGITIHAHPVTGSFVMNAADDFLAGVKSKGADVWASGENERRFSRSDYKSGPGDLAIPGGDVLFQDGRASTVRNITAVPCNIAKTDQTDVSFLVADLPGVPE